LPVGLKHFSAGHSFDEPARKLPSGLLHLEVGRSVCDLIELPTRLTHLKISATRNLEIGHLPPTLSHLILGDGVPYHVVDPPPALTHLALYASYRHCLAGLPQTMRVLFVCMRRFGPQTWPGPVPAGTVIRHGFTWPDLMWTDIENYPPAGPSAYCRPVVEQPSQAKIN
jgi:hypothetical protein